AEVGREVVFRERSPSADGVSRLDRGATVRGTCSRSGTARGRGLYTAFGEKFFWDRFWRSPMQFHRPELAAKLAQGLEPDHPVRRRYRQGAAIPVQCEIERSV